MNIVALCGAHVMRRRRVDPVGTRDTAHAEQQKGAQRCRAPPSQTNRTLCVVVVVVVVVVVESAVERHDGRTRAAGSIYGIYSSLRENMAHWAAKTISSLYS